MENKEILVTQSSLPPFDEYIEEIAPLWKSHWLTNMGEKHGELEERLKEYLDAKYLSLFTNGHSALECILEAMNLEGEVITTPFTFASTTHAIVRKGLIPVFADVTEENYTLDPSKIERLITSRTCAILPVHVYGNLCDTEAIQEVADKYGLKVIYDAAHAFGVSKNGCSSACFGDVSMFSFHATKVFNTIEGGLVSFKDSSLYDVLNQWKNFGITGPESVEYIGGNAKLNEFCAAMGLCNLRHLDSEIEKRRRVVERYRDNFEGVSGIKVVKPQVGVKSNYAYFPIIFKDNFGQSRDEVFSALAAEGVKARKYFYPIVSDYSCYRGKFEKGFTPVAAFAAARVLTLPLYADLAFEDVDRICAIVKGCAK